MAKVQFSVIFLVFLYQVVASRDCKNLDIVRNCDECIRCGAYWCNNPKEPNHCSKEKHDNWCTGSKEELLRLDKNEAGTYFSPKYSLQTIYVGKEDDISVRYPETDMDKIDLTYNSTQSTDFQIQNYTTCSSGECITKVVATPWQYFCANDGRMKEFITVKLNVKGIEEEAMIDFHVPCACTCSQFAEKHSAKCNGRGTYSCGVCACDEGWEGDFCQQEHCEPKRGDIPCSDGICSGNGVCGNCNDCQCFTDRPDSRYFSSKDFCVGICTTTNACEDCFLNSKLMERCQLCHLDLYRRALNETMMKERDNLGRQMWVGCNHTIEGCNIEYAVMEDDNNERYYMIISNSCDPLASGYVGTINVTLPLVLVLGGVLLAGLAVAAYMAWMRPGPDQCVTPDYQTVGAEGCTGENPLYRPPTSSFKNPTYGKL